MSLDPMNPPERNPEPSPPPPDAATEPAAERVTGPTTEPMAPASGIERLSRAEAAQRIPEFPRLLDAAIAVQRRARAPYSKFRVGAAVLAGSGVIYPGCNVESASYGATICAERTAVVSAVAAGESEIRACVVVTSTPEPSSPCGICRQFLAEWGPAVAVLCTTPDGDLVHAGALADYLPNAFWAVDLEAAE